MAIDPNELIAQTYHINIKVAKNELGEKENFAIIYAEDTTKSPTAYHKDLLTRWHEFTNKHWMMGRHGHHYWNLALEPPSNIYMEWEYKDKVKKIQQQAKKMGGRVPGDKEAYNMAQLLSWAEIAICEYGASLKGTVEADVG